MVEDRYTDMAIGGDKLSQTVHLGIHKLPIPKSYYIDSSRINAEIVSEIFKRLQTKTIIMKGVSNHRGENNFSVSSVQEVLKIAHLNDNQFIFQEYIPNDFDYRLLVLGDRVRIAEMRKRLDNTTHLNNISQGAAEIFIPLESLSKEIIEMAVKSAKLFNLDVAGVDIIVSKETQKPYILEVNPSPAFTYTDSSPEFNALREYFTELIG